MVCLLAFYSFDYERRSATLSSYLSLSLASVTYVGLDAFSTSLELFV